MVDANNARDVSRRARRHPIRETLRLLLAGVSPDRGLAITAAVLLAFAGGVVAISLLGNGPEHGAEASIPTVHPAQEEPEPEEVFVPPEPTATPRRAVARDRRPTPTAEPRNRQDCEAIRGTEYRSATERAWFIQQCEMSPAAQAASSDVPAPIAATSSAPSPSPNGHGGAAGGPEPQARLETRAFSAETAIVEASVWLASQVPLGMELEPQSCVAVRPPGSAWTVSCLAEAPGCVGASCSLRLSACLIEEPLTVWSC